MEIQRHRLFEQVESTTPVDVAKYFCALKKSAAILLIFLFVFSPVATAYAQEEVMDAGNPALLVDDTSNIDSPIPDMPVEPDISSGSSGEVETSNPNLPNTDDSVIPKTLIPGGDISESVPDEINVPLEEADQSQGEEKKPNEETPMLMESEEGYDGPVDPKANEVGQRLARTDEHTGAAVTSLPIVVPPGRNGMQPNLVLSYNSQNQEDANVFGYGWSANIPYIERINKLGAEKLYSSTSPAFFSSSFDGELATTTATTTYSSRVDNGDMRSYIFSNNQWTVTDKTGTQYKFGHASSTQQTSTSSSSQIFRWMLEEVRDTNDNFVRYTYYKDSGQIYPDTIYYTGTSTVDGIFKVEFVRESRGDGLTSYKTGFHVKSLYRINQIKVYVGTNVVRTYDLAYTNGNNTVRSLLSSVQESGYAEGSTTPQSLPPTVFSYQSTNEGFSIDSSRGFPQGAFLNFEFGDKLADVNGDGLVDYLSSWNMSPQSNNIVYLQKPDGSWATSTTYTIPFVFYYTAGYTFHYTYMLISDLNGDGKTDLVHEDGSVYINNGSNWVLDANWDVPVYLSDPYPPHLEDVNGDGLVDIVAKNNSAVFLNLGNTWDTATSTIFTASSTTEFFTDTNNDSLSDALILTGTPFTVSLGNGIGNWISTTSSPTTTLVGLTIPLDIDGDNITDLFESSVDSGIAHRDAYQGTGQGWNRKTNWIQTDVNLRYNIQPTIDRAVDWNSDGLPDFSVGGAAKINQNKKADLLTKIQYPSGGFSAITYKPSTQYSTSNILDNPNLPIIVYTAQKIETNDGIATSTSDTYTYKGGHYYFNGPFDRKFAGFEQIIKTDAGGNVTKTFYHTASSTDASHGEYLDNYWKIGKAYRVEKYDNNNNLFEKAINKWEVATTTQAAGFVKLTQSVNYTYDGDSDHRDKAETYTYSTSTGSLTQKKEYGEVTGSDDGSFSDTGTDDFTTTYTYATSSTSSSMSLLASQSTVNNGSSKVSESRYYYDNLSLNLVNLGNLTKRESWTATTTYVDIEKTYNNYGLVTTEKDPRDKTTTYSYDANNLYPAIVTDPVSLVTRYVYDYSSGKVASTTDANGNNFANTYDGLDRVLSKQQPNISSTSTLETLASFAYTDTSRAVSVKQSSYLSATNTVDSYLYFDGLGRKSQERKEATSTIFSVRDFAYNNRGMLLKESLPYFSSGFATTTPTSTTTLYTQYNYDTLGRATSTINAIGTATYTYDDWKTTYTDLRGKAKNLFYDAYQNLVQVGEVPSPGGVTELYNMPIYSDGDLLSYYRMAGNSNDSKGSYNGTDSNMSYDTPYAKFGQGALFNGASGKIDVGNQLNSGTTFWVHGWFNAQAVPALSNNVAIFGNSAWTGNGQIQANIRGTGSSQFKVQFDLYGAGTLDSASTNLSGNTWYMWDFVYDYTNKFLNIYINGSLNATTSFATAQNLSNTTFRIGNNGAINNFWNGYMDDVAIFDRAPTSTEISDLYTGAGIVLNEYNTYYEYDGNNNLTKITDASSNVRNFTYDGLSRRLSAEDLHHPSDGTYGSYIYAYDSSGNLTQKVDPKSQTINYTYDDLNRVLTENYAGSAGVEVEYVYDSCSQGKSRLCTASSTAVTITSAYNALGQLTNSTSTINSTAYPTIYTYDRQGNKLTITNPDNSQVKYIYSTAGMVSGVQRKESTDSIYLDVLTNIDYAPTGQVTLLEYFNGAITTNTYDETKLYRLTRKVTTIPQEEDLGMRGSFMDEGEGDQGKEEIGETEIIDDLPETSPTTTTSTLSSLVEPSEEQGFLNKLWNMIAGMFSQAANHIASIFDVRKAFALGLELYSSTLFSDGNLVAYYRMENTNDSKNSYHLTADGSPSGVSAQFGNGYSYDGSNYHHTNSNLGINGGAVSISGWLKINSNPSSGTTWYITSQFNSTSKVEYDIWYGNSGGTYTLSVNRGKSGVSDNPVSINQNLADGNYHFVVLTYDGTNLKGYLDGSLFGTLATNGNGNGGSANDLVIAAAYNGTSKGNVRWDDMAVFSRALTSGEVNYLYSPVYTSLTIQDISYTYDSNGNIIEMFDSSQTDTARTVTYGYDDFNRLTTASTTSASITPFNYSYTYDALGNMLTRVENGTTTTYTYATNTPAYLNPHAPQKVGSATSTYDSNGNLLAIITGSATTTAYTWDYNNRLTQAVGNSATSTFSYDPSGQRVKMTVATTSSATTYYPSKFYNITGSTPTKHIFLPNGTMIASVVGTGTSTTVSYIHTDHLGGMNVATNDTPDVVQLLDYYPYGTKRLSEGTDVSQREFIGEFFDENVGLSYLNARYLNSNNAKFTSQDPVVVSSPEKFLTDPQQMNYYSYGRNSPIVIKDPSGLYVVSSGLVEKGDTLGKITGILNSTNGTNYTYQQVAQLNGISNPNLIYPGQTLIPNNKTPDVTKALNSVNKANAAVASSKAVVGGNYSLSTPSHLGGVDIAGFANNFRKGGDWDLKSQPGVFCQRSVCGGQYATNYVYDAQSIPGDAPGNIHYGYVGHASGKSLETLHTAGDVVQNATNLGSNVRNGNGNRSFPTWDPYIDKYYISWGYSLYGY